MPVRLGVYMCVLERILLIEHATRMRHIVTSLVAPMTLPYFSTLPHKRHDFRENVIGHKMRALILSTTFV
jgi:hypothetical protein